MVEELIQEIEARKSNGATYSDTTFTDIVKKNVEKISENSGYFILKIRWQWIVKLLEIICCGICISCFIGPVKQGNFGRSHFHHLSFILPTFFGGLLILVIFWAGQVFGEKIPYKTSFVVSLLLSCSFLASGLLLAVDWNKRFFRDEIILIVRSHITGLYFSTIVFSLLSSVLFAVDSLYICRSAEDF